MHSSPCQAPIAGECSKQRRLLLLSDAGCVHISIHELLGIVMGRNLVVPTPFLVQTEPHATALAIVVLDVHSNNGGNAGEAEHHHANESSVP